MGTLGTQEMIIIFLLALLIFGPKKLPELGKTVAKAMGEFRRASSELKSTWDREMQQIEKETEPIKQAAQEYHDQIHSGYGEDSAYYDYGGYDSGQSDSTATPSTSTVSDPATQGAEQTTVATADPAEEPASGGRPAAKAPEGTVAQDEKSPVETVKPVAG